MVTRLTGHINGEEIILQRDSGDRWIGIIPGIPSGMYIIDMTAWDDAGNMTYMTTCIITIDLTAICARVTVHDYKTIHEQQDYICNVIQENYISRVKVGEACDCI